MAYCMNALGTTCARLIPNDVRVTVEQQLPGNLSPEDWAIMQEIVNAVRQAVPDAGSKPPGAVLEHVLGALRPKSRLMAISANAIGGKLYAPTV